MCGIDSMVAEPHSDTGARCLALIESFGRGRARPYRFGTHTPVRHPYHGFGFDLWSAFERQAANFYEAVFAAALFVFG